MTLRLKTFLMGLMALMMPLTLGLASSQNLCSIDMEPLI